MKHVEYIELNALAFIYSCTIGQVRTLLVYYKRMYIYMTKTDDRE